MEAEECAGEVVTVTGDVVGVGVRGQGARRRACRKMTSPSSVAVVSLSRLCGFDTRRNTATLSVWGKERSREFNLGQRTHTPPFHNDNNDIVHTRETGGLS